jgi:AcrR family transcriptional regulator
MARAQDPRSLRTVTALRGALRGILRSRPLDEVSVTEICRVADVRRTTFYTHYAGVADLLTELLTTEIDELLVLSYLKERSVGELAERFQVTLVAALEIVKNDRHLFRAGFDSDASAVLRRAMLSLFARRVEIALAIWQSHGAAVGVDTAVAVPFAAGGLATAFEAWAFSSDADSRRWAGSVRDQMPGWWPR